MQLARFTSHTVVSISVARFATSTALIAVGSQLLETDTKRGKHVVMFAVLRMDLCHFCSWDQHCHDADGGGFRYVIII